MREMLEGGPSCDVPHRRLPRRADHADPRQGHDEGPVARATRGPSSASSRTASASRSRAACRSSATPAASTPPGSPTGSARSRRASASTRRSRTSRATTCAAPELGLDGALTANAYLGGFGIAAALTGGADVVVTGRVTDASLVVGPAVAHHGWTPDVVRRAGRRGRRRPRARVRHPGDRRQLLRLPRRCRTTGPPLGLPARRDRRRRVERDHQARRHRRRGHRRHRHRAAASTRSSRPATSAPTSPPTSTSIELAQAGPDRVAISGVRGEAPPERLKVCVNELGGFRNTVEFVLTGLDIEAKADWVREQLDAALDRRADASPGRSRRAAARRRRHRGGRVLPAAVHGQGPVGRPGRPGVHRRRRSSSRWRPTPASR